MLESFIFIATGWFLAGVSFTVAQEQIVADEAVLKSAGLKTDNETLLAFFQNRTLSAKDMISVQQLIRQLGSETYRLREQAMAELINKGPAALEMLREAAKNNDLEIAKRAEKCLNRIEEKDVPLEVAPAAVRLLAVRKPAAAVQTMLAYLPFADNDSIADEARNLLTLAAQNDGKSHPAILAALTDTHPIRRAAAGEALTRSGPANQKSAVLKLLGDSDAYVRLRVAMALAQSGEKDAIPVLIDILPKLTLMQAWQAEEVLFHLAEGKSPPAVSVGTDVSTRFHCRAAWQAWWKNNSAKVDLAKLQERPRLLGYTLIVLLDKGRVMELDADNRTRWQVDDLIFPLDAQALPGDRLLVAEYYGRRVTERNRKGEVLWQKEIAGPLVAQRLDNGNTFIATDNSLIEYDRADKELYNLNLPGGERIMKAVKLPNGEIACLTDAPRVVRLDTSGKELYSYTISLGKLLFGGRIYMLPNGRVLIPHYAENKVVEYDVRGKAVWELAVDEPVAAVRLPNGNTLVTTMLPQRGAIEFDRNGQEVWSYRTSTRVTRALRR